MGRIVVGTSSWADPGFVEEWYPDDLPARERLPWYAERLEAVEVNSTFYAVPAASTVARWADQTPDGFTFDVKLHRLLSRHSAGLNSLPKDLRRPAKTTPRGRVKLDDKLQKALADAVLEAVEPLAEAGKLASFLLQLSPGFAPRSNDLDELAPLVERLAPHPVAIELRRSSWLRGDRAEQTLEWMERHAAAWVCTDMPEAEHLTIMPPLDAVTTRTWPTSAPTAATPRATSRAAPWPSASPGATATTSWRRSAAARTSWPRTPTRSA